MRAQSSKLRRTYVPGAPLFAQRPLKFRGVSYMKHDALPIEVMSKVRHHRLWISGLASHDKFGPFDKRKAARVEAVSPPPPPPKPAKRDRR